MTVEWSSKPWAPVAHACRFCLGRVLEAVEPVQRGYRGLGQFACSSCGVSAIGLAKGICGCGLKTDGQKAERFRCVPNPSPGPANLSEIIIAAGQVPAKATPTARPPANEQDNERASKGAS